MNATPEQINAVRAVARAIVETGITDALVRTGQITRRGDCFFAV